jgi:hypothetical protein
VVFFLAAAVVNLAFQWQGLGRMHGDYLLRLFLGSALHGLLLIVLAVAALRALPQWPAAVVGVALVYPAPGRALSWLSFRTMVSGGQPLPPTWIWEPTGLLLSGVWAASFLGGLGLALRLVRPLPLALFAGASLGELVATGARVVAHALQGHPGLSPWSELRQLPATLLAQAVFAGALWLGLLLTASPGAEARESPPLRG